MLKRNAFSIVSLALLLGLGLPAWGQNIYVPPANRELLLFINVTDGYTGAAKDFYAFVEFSAESLAKLNLGHRYNRVHVVKGTSATRANLVNRIDSITSRSGLLALDMIFVTHGLGDRVFFSGEDFSIGQVRNAIVNGVPSSQRWKLRAVFSTACYGSEHRQGWRDAGFKAASGSRQIYADSALSYTPFLSSWGGYSTFRTAVDAANAADPLRIQDQIAKTILLFNGYPNWFEVDSFRLRQGFTGVRVHTQVIPGL